MRAFLLLVLIFVATLARATDCDAGWVSEVTDAFEKSSGRQLYNQNNQENDDHLSSCKLLHGTQGLAAMAFASYDDVATRKSILYGGKNYASRQAGEGFYDFIVLLVRVK